MESSLFPEFKTFSLLSISFSRAIKAPKLNMSIILGFIIFKKIRAIERIKLDEYMYHLMLELDFSVSLLALIHQPNYV